MVKRPAPGFFNAGCLGEHVIRGAGKHAPELQAHGFTVEIN